MKSFLYQLIGIITCVSFVVACGDDDTDLSGLMLDKTDITVGAEGGTDRLLVQSSTEWVAAASEPWVMVSPANGVGTTECQVVIDSTLVNDVREATISFTPSGQLPQIVTIHQTGFEKVIKLENLDCANCGMLLERSVAKVEGVTSSNVNFMAQKLIIEFDEGVEGVIENVKKTAKRILPDVTLLGV